MNIKKTNISKHPPTPFSLPRNHQLFSVLTIFSTRFFQHFHHSLPDSSRFSCGVVVVRLTGFGLFLALRVFIFFVAVCLPAKIKKLGAARATEPNQKKKKRATSLKCQDISRARLSGNKHCSFTRWLELEGGEKLYWRFFLRFFFSFRFSVSGKLFVRMCVCVWVGCCFSSSFSRLFFPSLSLAHL